MATVSSVEESLKVVGACSFCLDYFKNPVTIDCGHNFCLSCITYYWQRVDTKFLCPQCKETSKQGTLMPNKQLANVIEIAKMLSQCSKRQHEDHLCEEHKKELKLFCSEDRRPICVACDDGSQDHKCHTVIPIEEAAQEYKEKIKFHMDLLRKQLDEILIYKSSEQMKAELLKRETDIKKQKIMSEFQELHQFLNEEQQILLSRLEEEEKEFLQRTGERMIQLEAQRSSLIKLISEIEKKCQQSAIELLKDVKDTLSRCQKVKIPKQEAVSTEGKMCFQLNYPRQNIILRKLFAKFGETHTAELEWWMKYGRYAVDVTLDPGTAHPKIVLSEDRKHVRHGNTRHKLPDNPERFNTTVSVLGCEIFTSGKHYWEVEVGDTTDWAFGVCKDTVNRKGRITLSPVDGYWALGLWDENEYSAYTSPTTDLLLKVKPQAVGIFLDYEARKVSFYNADEKSHLFTFPDIFAGNLRPYFSPGLNTGGTNVGALRIRPIPDWQ
ncbi:E3 ubiquitin-protein ligase TRIM39-like [Rhinatrema bivittatum]|uniref:E3 ubiquitin-protein ligase TRIM39-like n=1 Tax=Rhinatrema bivittatum TaxID=194408 RepID=UPI00112C05BE|nr:E3 ubiquitin-protein ligase TRIM39-like [Rhinatrema bivittatum]